MRLSLLFAAAVLSTSLAAHADNLIFNLVPTATSVSRSAGSGPAQGVLVAQTTTISGFSFYLETPAAESLNFFITDAAGTTLLYSGVEAVGSTSSFGWVESNPLSFTLNAGSEYYFGVVGDGSSTVNGYLITPAYSANGLTADTHGNANATGTFSNPTPLRLQSGDVEIGLQLYAPAATTPEPSSVALLGTGLLGVAGVLRRRFSI